MRVRSAITLGLLWLSPINFAWADLSGSTQVSIPMDSSGDPATDLVNAVGVRVPRNDASLRDTQNLWKLDPDPTATLWQGRRSTEQDRALDLALPIQPGETLTYQADVPSPSQRFYRFIATQASGRMKMLVASSDLHTLLLRKELLRRLGYRIPAVKWLSSVKVDFRDSGQRDSFLLALMNGADRPSSRWVMAQTDTSVTLQDVAAVDYPVKTDLIFGPPQPSETEIKPDQARIYRALAIAYGLVNLPESVNQFSWSLGQVDNQIYHFGLPDLADFNCTKQDALWMLHLMAPLTRADFARMVRDAGFPDDIGQLVVEKLVSRRNAAMRDFAAGVPKLTPAPNAKLSLSVTGQPTIVNGKVLQGTRPGYATHFTGTDVESPFKDLRPYVLSEAITLALQGGVPALNNLVPQLNISSDIRKHQNRLIQDAIDHYEATGEIQKLSLRPWTAPLLGGNVQESRGIYVGSFMGTNNLVQVYDTFGVSLNAGLYIGVDGLPSYFNLSANAGGSVTLSVTRVQPIIKTDLQAAVHQQYTDNFLPIVTFQAAHLFSVMASATGASPAPDPVDLKTKLAQDMDVLRTLLNVGDSLILTESATASGNVAATMTAPVWGAPAAIGQVGAAQQFSRRIQVLRGDANTIVVFKDGGNLTDVPFAFSLTTGKIAQFPVATGYTQLQRSSAHCAIYTLNILPDPAQNPDFAKNAIALNQVLRSGSTSILDENSRAANRPPIEISSKSKDHSSYLQFLEFVWRSLKSNQQVHFDVPQDNAHYDYIYTVDGTQKGVNYQQLVTQLGTYLIQRFTHNSVPGIPAQGSMDPGQSIGGHSETREADYQAKVEKGLTHEFLTIKHRWAGTHISTGDVYAKLDQEKAYFGFSLFGPDPLQTATSVSLYEITSFIDLYGPALDSLRNVNDEALKKQYWASHRCDEYFSGVREGLSGTDMRFCNHFDLFQTALYNYRKEMRNHPSSIGTLRKASAYLVSAAVHLKESIPFKDFVNLIGGSDNLYVHARIAGFRNGSETASDPIENGAYGSMNPDYQPGMGILDDMQQHAHVGSGEARANWLNNEILY